MRAPVPEPINFGEALLSPPNLALLYAYSLPNAKFSNRFFMVISLLYSSRENA